MKKVKELPEGRTEGETVIIGCKVTVELEKEEGTETRKKGRGH